MLLIKIILVVFSFSVNMYIVPCFIFYVQFLFFHNSQISINIGGRVCCTVGHCLGFQTAHTTYSFCCTSSAPPAKMRVPPRKYSRIFCCTVGHCLGFTIHPRIKQRSKANSPVATFALCSPYSSSLENF